MAITDKEQGVWILDEVYNKQNQGGIWDYSSDANNLFLWGSNPSGVLGLNQAPAQLSKVSSPTQVGTDDNWQQAGTMGTQSFAIKTNGSLWAWGANTNGFLGLNNTTKVSSPTQVGTDTTWSTISKCSTPGQGGCLANKTDGTLWSWGYQSYGNLGFNQSSPQKISSPTQLPGTWSNEFAMCPGHAVAIKPDGTLWAWGARYRGQVGNNQYVVGQKGISSPTQIGTDTTWSKVVGGTSTSGAIKTDGTLWMWGGAEKGVLGENNPINVHRSSPTQVPGTWSTVQVIGSQAAVHGIKTDGTLWSWGSNDAGMLGLNQPGSTGDRSSPVQVGTDTTWDTVNSGGERGICRKTDGTWWVWGANQQGKLGLNAPETSSKSSPTQMPGTWDSIKFRDSGTIALKIS